MNVYIQKEYENLLNPQNTNLGINVYYQYDQLHKYDVLVGDVEHLKATCVNDSGYKFVITDKSRIDFGLIAQLHPTKVFTNVNMEDLVNEIQWLYQTHFMSSRIESNSSDDQISQKVTERLRLQLHEKSESLKFFINEENVKKNKEKKLLYFLDFLNIEHDKSDFIDSLCKLLWLDLKKIGVFNLLGFFVRLAEEENTLIVYDGNRIKFFHNVTLFDGNQDQFSHELANILQRPLASTKFWLSRKNNLNNYFILESKIQVTQPESLESYISERIDLVLIMIQRHMIRLQASYLLTKWNVFSRAYKNPMHVVDDQFNVIQSNYFPQQRFGDDRSDKCYAKLANRDTPCANCPIISLQDSNVTIAQKKYKSHITKFYAERTHYFIFYEDQTERDLLKSKMIQNEKMNVIGQLANHLAHELNNPLTGLKLNTEFILQQPEYAESTVRSDFIEVLKGIDRCKNIISDLLEFSSDKSPELELGTVADIIKRTIPLLKSITRNHSVFVDVKSVAVNMHKSQLQQVIFNLIKNSCQAMSTKGVVKIYDVDSPIYYDVIFEDNGPGLSNEIVESLFQPFMTTKKIGEGTGLGLYISKSILQRMGADLMHDSQYKNGARFILRFKK